MKSLIAFFTLILAGLYGYGQTLETQSKTFDFYIKSRDKSPASIFWLDLNAEVTISENQRYNLKAGIKCPSRITDVQISVNGKLPMEERGLSVVSANTQSGEFDYFVDENIPLVEGDNKIEIRVTNSYGVETRETKTIRFANDLVARRDLALIFATDQYDNWDDLTNPIFDAKTIAEELEGNYRFEVEILENSNISDILIKLKEYAGKPYAENDQLFIFFAGHGHYDDLLGDGYIVGKDSKRDDPANTSYLSFSVIGRALNNIPSEHVFLAMDVCFGGTFDEKLAKSSRGGENTYAEISRNEFISRRLQYKTRKFLTSGGKEYVPDGRPGMHSPFANKFIEALRTGGGRDRVLTLSEILNEVSTINPAPHFGDFGDNEAGSDFIFVSQ